MLRFWFGHIPGRRLGLSESLVLPTRIPYWGRRWTRRYLDLDEVIRVKFGTEVRKAAAGELDPWGDTPQGRLAVVLVLDQLSRSVHRGTPRAFDLQARALPLAVEAADQGLDEQFYPLARAVFYHPLMHAESLELQDRCVGLFERAVRDTRHVIPRVMLQMDLRTARRHRAIVARFGRFPQRNVVLRRDSTAEERRFLQRGSSPL